jgi:hypothetical protein
MTATTKPTRAATLIPLQQANSTVACGLLSEIGGGKVISFSRRAVAPRCKLVPRTWDRNDESNVVRFTRVKSSHSGLQRTAAAVAKAQTKAIEASVTEEWDDYRYQMLVNGLVAAFVGMLVISGQWMLTILAKIP